MLPSTGRPPTPPLSGGHKQVTSSRYFASPASVANRAPPMSKTPVLGRQPASRIPSLKKSSIRQNQSILQFFGKADNKNEVDAKSNLPLFFKDASQSFIEQDVLGRDERTFSEDDSSRFNENEGPLKRRRTIDDDGDFFIRTPSPERKSSVTGLDTGRHSNNDTKPVKARKQRGGFLDDSSDEEDEDWVGAVDDTVEQNSAAGEVGEFEPDDKDDIDPGTGITTSDVPLIPSAPENEDAADHDRHERTSGAANIPELPQEETSIFNAGDFGEDDFEEDEFYEGGEEFLERRWMEEQREMGLTFEEDSKSESGADSVRTPRSIMEDDLQIEVEQNDTIPLCPICNGNMQGLSESQASTHVNACLDGTAEPLPKENILSAPEKPRQASSAPGQEVVGTKRFQRAAVARPAQSNPFSVGADVKGGSAFTRLMSGHAEDAAWAEAAAHESRSRGKPAYQRTCPFYKIMPGFYICVDAFRYGKVEGQNAYFLSHFHSDHYIGLTSSWCHGPIYASKVTCNLMLQQLKVDPKWVVPLEFEKKVEVPNTNGVCVTMIPANHCPGSSLYLFEKVTGKNRDGTLKNTRILHCGDFRACPAHVNHPLLQPDVMCSITGQLKQQVIDTCYLDTTYLTPKYSFPSQSDVIDACSQMCISLSKEIVDLNDDWERTKADRAGSTMKKFLEQGESTLPKQEGDDSDRKPKKRGRLLVVIGTYSIGKERICLGIAKALGSKIYAPPAKMRICKCLEDDELTALLTSNPLEASVHMQTLMEIRAETLHEYMTSYKGHFARVVGFRPTGWSYRPPTSRFTENPAVSTVLTSDGWKSRFSIRDLAPQRGSTRESNCFGVPYSEHSSFRELTMFCCALRINRVIPTVNVGSARSREKMKGWIEKWEAEKRKNGLFKVEVGAEGWGSGDGKLRYGV
ncbi:DNA cross-link repair protein PSO2/SNM1 [Knufia peltigerae]|uniref:DNA cross-link repair protein PSO2/SNM1 n=1 Tax=Knufia peltigerae TaxID=1002370 RepID=A0AA39CZV9_9EURO|nr:DNA cross-link repair protein PSO2/SNM1 [Knufia peltigerae]